MSVLDENDSLLLIIDVQEKLLNAVFNKESLEKKAAIMSRAATILGIQTIVTEQYPQGLGSTVNSVKENLLNINTSFYEKNSFSALDEENVFDAIRKSQKKQILILGIETHICVNQTVNALIELGFDVSVIKDACGSRTEIEHNAGIDRMREDGAHIITTEIALFEWLKSSKHPNFKEIQALIK